ncbi:hypothetical protein IMG5_045980 [Ichthyophthirius multifiliis]|uniref:Uncharacterized protein n=1 Tax=Ichthyophthirius multifiliis TaxID=5932 RepID=G0QM80_ICHMU|nr:hypothetical protein IMG5_045980 [Ichthyophthirius multifiliis]EGR33683.1 hypothetical protein IMG5_045980 [Ichthyophthirius multifiliis]|eukprot:XP_004037669.1 hypothetical protein IMG5_045980 [Ichthyophthirius multifiliis]
MTILQKETSKLDQKMPFLIKIHSNLTPNFIWKIFSNKQTIQISLSIKIFTQKFFQSYLNFLKRRKKQNQIKKISKNVIFNQEEIIFQKKTKKSQNLYQIKLQMKKVIFIQFF